MKKLAIFVEGKTEQIFVAKLLREIAGKFQISIEIKSRQGINFDKVIMKDSVTSETKFYVLIYNSCRDESVVSDMKEWYHCLTEDGYDRVIGLRDVYPISIADKSKLERGLNLANSVPSLGEFVGYIDKFMISS
ncbi:hypothetical protein [Aphanizomenon sp. UHCC 0183]|uniref:hypothetical protein n=1 Tax=Aphanizomenon sp. UHCC 0183 TaxID=2590028 RepID=UPI0014454431|nr:hypothetical protein [Aphanizomenon sp. UHCC 0183]MTJ31388.1 hypothetical protein [Aphanizomenon sp. UHCC 0183]